MAAAAAGASSPGGGGFRPASVAVGSRGAGNEGASRGGTGPSQRDRVFWALPDALEGEKVGDRRPPRRAERPGQCWTCI